MKMSVCHTDRQHWGKGLCKRCWQSKWKRENPERVKTNNAKYRSEHREQLRIAASEYYSNNKEKARAFYQKNKKRICKRVRLRANVMPDRHIVERYGITLECWLKIFEKQGRVCGICKTDRPKGRGWHTDHDHETNKVRGILCGTCNTGIGMLKDDICILNNAVKYLKRSVEG